MKAKLLEPTILSYFYIDPITKQSIFSIECLIRHLNDTYDGLKLCNFNSQKGLVNSYIDLDKRYPDIKPDILYSPFSLLSRMPIQQLQEVERSRTAAVTSRSIFNTDEQTVKNSEIMCGFTELSVLHNISAEHRSIGAMRFDNLSINILNINGCHIACYTRLQESHDKSDRYKVLPKQNLEPLQLCLLIMKNIEFYFGDSPKPIDLYQPATQTLSIASIAPQTAAPALLGG